MGENATDEELSQGRNSPRSGRMLRPDTDANIRCLDNLSFVLAFNVGAATCEDERIRHMRDAASRATLTVES